MDWGDESLGGVRGQPQRGGDDEQVRLIGWASCVCVMVMVVRWAVSSVRVEMDANQLTELPASFAQLDKLVE